MVAARERVRWRGEEAGESLGAFINMGVEPSSVWSKLYTTKYRNPPPFAIEYSEYDRCEERWRVSTRRQESLDGFGNDAEEVFVG